MQLMLKKGGMYKVYNGNLLFHGCVPMNSDGSFKAVNVNGKEYSGKDLYDAYEACVRKVLVSNNKKEKSIRRKYCQNETEITELLGIEYPIIQGGMAWVAEYHLAAAVSEAGGLGIIGAASAPPEWVRDQIQKAKKMTDKPFGVNIMLMSPYADEIAKVIVEEKVKVVTTGAGSPEKYMQMWKEADVKVIPVVASVALAKRMERCHADAVVAEGTEAGGHIGEASTMTLVPQVVDAVKIPVIAAGGIADGRGIAAAFMLGAKGVQMGTAFIVTEECQVHEIIKMKL